MKIEYRYVVLKKSDMKYLRESEIETIRAICEKIRNGREIDAKKPLDCLCIERDWPEYIPTLNLLSARVDAEGSNA